MPQPIVALFLVASSPNCLKVVTTWISSAQFFFSPGRDLNECSFVVLN